jgi:hypothetical protein
MKVTSSLAGKALDIFGGGTEHRKLRAICSIFPHDDNINNENILNVYAEAFGYLRSVFTGVLLRAVVLYL